jgi:hypothetical protein
MFLTLFPKKELLDHFYQCPGSLQGEKVPASGNDLEKRGGGDESLPSGKEGDPDPAITIPGNNQGGNPNLFSNPEDGSPIRNRVVYKTVDTEVAVIRKGTRKSFPLLKISREELNPLRIGIAF